MKIFVFSIIKSLQLKFIINTIFSKHKFFVIMNKCIKSDQDSTFPSVNISRLFTVLNISESTSNVHP